MLLKMGIQFIYLRHFKRYETKLKLQGLEIFDSSHLIALLVSFVFIFFLPYLGKLLTKEQQKIIVFGIIFFAIVQEIIDYANQYPNIINSQILFSTINSHDSFPMHTS